MRVVNRRIAASLAAAAAMFAAPFAQAVQFQIGEDINGTLNSVFTAGAGIRMEDRSVNNVGKANLDPNVCGGTAQSCQGVFKDQTHPARTLARSPGQAFLNADDGNWNYDRGDLTQAVFKVTQDVSLTWGDYGFFGKWLYFYDFVNNNFTEFHPNLITNENKGRTGCGPNSNSTCTNNTTFTTAYGPGEPTYLKRTDGETLRQIGTDLQIFDYYIFGSNTLPIGENGHNFSWKLGSQTLNWGESTALVINSVNQVNPVNANNLFRVGFDLSELFTPTRMAFLSTDIVEGVTLETYYGFEWKPLEIPAAGSFFSFADLSSYNGGPQGSSISFGGPAEDPDVCTVPSNGTNPNSGCGSPTNNPLSGLTGTALTIRRLGDHNPSQTGQYGLSVKYFADWLNNGTQLSFYFENYHSKLPYVSFMSSDESCARMGDNGSNPGGGANINATSGPELIAACPGLPVITGDPATSTSNAVPIDTVRYQVEYPENIRLFGASFNTTLGDFSLQGELSYRPNLPLQIDLQDLTFLALQPMLSRCHDTSGPCTGTTGGLSSVDNVQYGSSDFQPYPGVTAYNDTFDLGVGAADGSARSFPSFIGAYRGIPAGEQPANSYIRGWERFGVWQMDLGATYVEGATDNVIGADQVIWLFELGAQFVPGLPGTDVLQIEAPNTNYHASAGADGTMSGNMKQDCASTVDCNYNGYNPQTGQFYSNAGDAHPCTQAVLDATTAQAQQGCGDGLRFNPHQEPAEGYADKFSTGIVIVNLTRYESVFPGISFAPITIFQWDVKGTSVDVASQFTEGRKDITFLFETRYKESLSFTLGYLFFTGGHGYNTQSDRDQALGYVKYQF